ncbi:MAG: response regulator [Acidobacteriia bacterium]|nr:response regulator [Terriglobia bacterium]
MVVHVGSPEETQDQGKPTLELGVAPPDRPQTDRPQLDQVKGVFLASLNHEIRTPLSGIMGMLDLLLETSIDDDQRDYLNAARLCAESLSELLNSSLEYAALEAGQISLEETEFSVKEMLESALAQQRPKADIKQLRLRLTLDPGLPETLIGDASRLRELMGHLVNNAIKFTHTGSVDVRVSLRTTATVPKPDVLVAEVRDTGIGIPSDKLATLFESFQPGESGFARAYPGLGLGLALAQKLAKVMGGRILVESRPGVGSTFTLEAPLRRPAATEGQQARVTDLGPAVLAVEDDPIGITVLRHVLQRRLKNVDCVASGREALEAAARKHYDLVLMDLQMPDINGLEAALRIRQMEGYRDVPILALTASCSDQVREQCRAIGMKAFLSKPIDANELWSAVSRYLGREIPRQQ